MPRPLRLLLPFSASAALAAAATSSTGWLDQSWFFSWDPPNLPFPVPTTAQCDTLHITWSRQTATGPDPVAPYILQIYSSNYFAPFTISTNSNIPETYFTVPFAPGSEYEICMFDAKGSTGGCQAIYTVYPNTTTSTPTCTNVTAPAKTLNVVSEATQGNLSPYGWVPSCSDIRVTPQNGKPPFTFTVAPALHPPLNITSNDMSPINWTVSLTWASPFFISLVDSQGLSWSNGPIHSGKGTTECIGGSSSHPSVGVTVGAALAGAAIGAGVSLLAAYLLSRRRKRYIMEDDSSDRPIPFYATSASPTGGDGREDIHHSRSSTRVEGGASRYARLPSGTGALNEFHVEPFVPSRASVAGGGGGDTASLHGVQSPASSTAPGRADGGGGGTGSQVYVIHHDMGRAPVSVVTAEGTEIVELPPGYSTSFDPNNREQQRQQADRQQQQSDAATSTTSGAVAGGSQSATTSSGGGRGAKVKR